MAVLQKESSSDVFAFGKLNNDPAEGSIQTEILKAWLTSPSAVEDGILSQNIRLQFDSLATAVLCDRAGLS